MLEQFIVILTFPFFPQTRALGAQTDGCILGCHASGYVSAIRWNRKDKDGNGGDVGQAFIARPHPYFTSKKGKKPNDFFEKLGKSKLHELLVDPIQAEIFLTGGGKNSQPLVHTGVLTKRGLCFVKYNSALKKVELCEPRGSVRGACALASNGIMLAVLTVSEMNT